jgi:DNA-binding protein H-NS
MDFTNFDEFWKALGRLYDSTLKNTEDIRELRVSIEELRSASQHLLSAVEKHQEVVESHERRLDRTEITVEAILEDLRRHREGRASQ